MTFKEQMEHKILKARDFELTNDERFILNKLWKAWEEDRRMTQSDLLEVFKNKRAVRQCINDLRNNYKIPIISGTHGYSFPRSMNEVDIFVKSLESKAKASAAAYFKTYKSMQEAFNVTSNFFESYEQGNTF